jgi:hypothetical protein
MGIYLETNIISVCDFMCVGVQLSTIYKNKVLYTKWVHKQSDEKMLGHKLKDLFIFMIFLEFQD